MSIHEHLLHDEERDDDAISLPEITNRFSRRRFTGLNLDPEPKLTKKKRLYKSFNRYNLTVASLLIILSAVGVAVGVPSYFVMIDKEYLRTLDEFTASSVSLHDRFTVSMSDFVRSMDTMKGLYSIRNGSVNFYTEFIPFMQAAQMLNGSSNLSARGVRGFQWVPLVKNVDRESFIQKTRASGPDFVNFSIRDRVNGSLVNASIQDDYYVILHAAPLSSSQELLGYNLISSEHEEREILLSRYAGVDTATSTFNLLENEKGFLYFSPVYTGIRNGDFVGLTCGVFHVVSLFSSFIDDHVVLFVYDKNVTDQQDETWMVHTTYTNGDVTGFSWPNPTVSNYLQVIRAAPYTVNRTVTIGDRKWEIVFFPKTKFIKERNGWEKYAALSISISVAVFTALVLSGVVKWLQYRDKLHRLNLQRVSILEENKKNLTEFLDRIAEQEEDSRNTMDCIPDHIVVLDDSGKIIKMNASFERAFNVTSIKFQQGITIDQYLTQLDHLFFTRGLIDQIETTIKKQTGLLVPVTVTVRPMGRYRFLVVIRNMAEKLTLIEQLQKQESEMKIMSGMMKFDQQLQDEEFRKRLLKYCQQEYNAENAEFIETIIQYKNSSVTQRMDLQEVIFNQYIAIGSPKQLNIEQELVTETAVKISKSLGEANVFDSVLEKVKIMLCTDILPRFYQSNLHS